MQDPRGGHHGGPWGRETRRKANGGRAPLPPLCALCGEDQTRGREDRLAIGNRRSPPGFFRITTEGTGDTEGEGGRGFGVAGRSRARSRERGSLRGEPGRIERTGKEGECDRRKISSSPSPPRSRCPRWWTRFLEHRRKQGGLGGTGKKNTVAYPPGALGFGRATRIHRVATTGDLGEGKQGGRRTADGILSPPSVLSVPSVVKIKREGKGRIGDREAAGYRGVFSESPQRAQGTQRGGRGARFCVCWGSWRVDRGSGVH